MSGHEEKKLGWLQRLKYWWFGGADVDLGGDAYSITVYPGRYPRLKRAISSASQHPVGAGLIVSAIVALASAVFSFVLLLLGFL